MNDASRRGLAVSLVVVAACSAPEPPRRAAAPARAHASAPEPAASTHGGRGFDAVLTWRIAELPILHTDDEPAIPRAAEDLVVDVARYRETGDASVHARVRVREAALGLMEVAGYTGAQGPFRDLDSGTSVRCGASPWSSSDAAWWTVLRPRAGGVGISIGEGWFLHAGCSVMLSRRMTALARAASLSPPVLVFRAAPEREREAWMGLVLPRAIGVVSDGVDRSDIHRGSFTLLRVPAVRGRSISIVVALAGLDIAAFETALGLPPRAHAAELTTVDVEVSQATGDDEPVAAAYLSRRASPDD